MKARFRIEWLWWCSLGMYIPRVVGIHLIPLNKEAEKLQHEQLLKWQIDLDRGYGKHI